MQSETKKVLQDVSHRYPPSSFYSAGEFFRTLHKQTKAETKQYSYRQLSADLGFSATNLVHLIVQGKRPVTERAATVIAKNLDLHDDEEKYFLTLAKLTRGKKSEDIAKIFREALEIRSGMFSRRLDREGQAYYSQWFYPAIRELVQLDGFKAEAEWIAQAFDPPLKVEEAREALTFLQDNDLIQYDEVQERWVQCDSIISTGPDSAPEAVKTFHKQAIPLGLKALDQLEADNRHYSSVILGVNALQFDRMKQEIELFHQKLLQIEADRGGGGNANRVVQLNIQLFPLTSH